MVDNIFRTRSLGTAAEGLRDQYADGKAARVWEVYIGDKSSRTENYRNFITNVLRSKNCRTVLDLACGTGSVTLTNLMWYNSVLFFAILVLTRSCFLKKVSNLLQLMHLIKC